MSGEVIAIEAEAVGIGETTFDEVGLNAVAVSKKDICLAHGHFLYFVAACPVVVRNVHLYFE